MNLKGIILGMGSANERRRYYVTPFLTGPAQPMRIGVIM